MKNVKVNIDNDKNINVYKAIFFAISRNNQNGIDMLDDAVRNNKDGIVNFDIEFKVNGVELDFGLFMDNLINKENVLMEKEVREVLKDKFIDIVNKANTIIDDLDYIDLKINDM